MMKLYMIKKNKENLIKQQFYNYINGNDSMKINVKPEDEIDLFSINNILGVCNYV